MYNEVIQTLDLGTHHSELSESTSALDKLIEDFQMVYERAAETSTKCRIRSKLISGLADGLIHQGN